MSKVKPKTSISKFLETLPERFERNENLVFQNGQTFSKQKGESLICQLPSGKKVKFITKYIDAKKCRVWKGNIRVQDFLNDETTKDLREKIQSQGQLVPVLARPLKDDPSYTHEIIYGSRRHYVCSSLNLGLKLLEADIEDNDAILFMDAENSGRDAPSAYETALAYQHWLTNGIFENQKELATKIGVTRTWVNQVISLSKIPKEIVGAFKNPKDLTLKMGFEINKIISTNDDKVRDLMLEKATHLKKSNLSPKAIFEELTNFDKHNSIVDNVVTQKSTSKLIFSRTGVQVCKISTTRNGKTMITFNSKLQGEKLSNLLEDFEKIVKRT